MTAPGAVLIVDDSATMRLKLAKAVAVIGHRPVAVGSGAEALQIVRTGDFDVVLLDIEMPEMDGFDVLRALKGEPSTKDLPVVVVSALEDDMESVVQCILLGAEDFLPKAFDPVLLRARLETSIDKKRRRDQELEFLKQVEGLITAANVMESGKFNPKRLNLESIAARGDALGRLARVFGDMAEQVFQRELALQQRIRTLKGGLLLLFVGASWGLMVPLSRLIAQEIPQSIAVTFWINLISGVLCLAWSAATRPGMRINRQMLSFILLLSFFNGGSSILLFAVAGHLSGIVLSILIALEGFVVFLFASLMRIEEPSLRRFAGLAIGLVAAIALLLSREQTGGVSDLVWILLALCIPALYGATDLLAATRSDPANYTPMTMGLILIGSAVLSLVLAVGTGQFYVPSLGFSGVQALVLLAAVINAAANVAYLMLIAWTGAVFASQSAYAITIAGIAWSIALLGESLTLWTLCALAMMILGLALVGAKNEAGDIEVEFRRRRRRTA